MNATANRRGEYVLRIDLVKADMSQEDCDRLIEHAYASLRSLLGNTVGQGGLPSYVKSDNWSW